MTIVAKSEATMCIPGIVLLKVVEPAVITLDHGTFPGTLRLLL